MTEERQSALTAVLHTMAASPTELGSVPSPIAQNAARFCDAGQRLNAAIEDEFETVPVGELELKGIARPVAAFSVVGPRR